MKIRLVAVLFALLAGDSLQAGPIENLKSGEWYEVPNSHMRSVLPTKLVGTMGNFLGIISAWSGGAFDTRRDRLIVWGGGHSNYAGNEIYVFDLNTLAWQRLTNPSDPPAQDTPYAADGGPCSRHTYNYIQYLPSPVDRFCSFGAAGFYSSGQTGTSHVDCFNFDNLTWERQKFQDAPVSGYIGAITAYDPVTGHLWEHYGGSGNMAELNPATGQWATRQNYQDGWFSYYITAEIDPVRRLMVGVGGGQVWSWNIAASGSIAGVKRTTSGDNSIVSANSPGFVYDPVSAKFVAWAGGANVYTLDADTWTWTKISPAASNTVTPTAPDQFGSFGRFRYSPSRNVFVIVSSIDENVFIYRLNAGTGTGVKAAVRAAAPAVTVSSNLLFRGQALRVFVPGADRYALYAPSGRKVRDLSPGAEWKIDVPAGVYVVRGENSAGTPVRCLLVRN